MNWRAGYDIDWWLFLLLASCGYLPIVVFVIVDVIRYKTFDYRIIRDIRKHRRPFHA